MGIDREPIPVGSYVLEPRSEGRWQALRYDMLSSHVGSMEDVLQAIAVDVAVRQDAIDADRAAMGASIQSAPSSPVDRWLTASAELPAALRAVTPEDLAAWLEAHGWTPIEYMHVQCSTLDDLARLGKMGWQAAALVEEDAGGRRTWSGLMMRAMVLP
jgi:hypothetical protein